METLTFAEMQKQIHDTAVEKGWWKDKRDFGEIIALIHSEVSEALECYRKGQMETFIDHGKPEGFLVELADAAIRIMDVFAFVEANIGEFIAEEFQSVRDIRADAPYPGQWPRVLCELHGMLSKAYAAEQKPAEALDHLRDVFTITVTVINQLGDAHDVMVQKMAYNKARPYRHGNKVC